MPLIQRAGVLPEDTDEGLIELSDSGSAKSFLETCAQLRLWEREVKTDLDAAGFVATQPPA
jgi:catalase